VCLRASVYTARKVDPARENLQKLDDESVGYAADLRKRPAYSKLPLRANGSVLVTVDFAKMLQNSVTAWHQVSLDAHKSAWIVCGYFEESHFSSISHRDAVNYLDPTGLWQQIGLQPLLIGQSHWTWELQNADGTWSRVQSSDLSKQLARSHAAHSHQRKEFQKELSAASTASQRAKVLDRLEAFEKEPVFLVYNRRTKSFGKPEWIQKNYQTVEGSLVKTGRVSAEVITLRWHRERHNDISNGRFALETESCPTPRWLRCVAVNRRGALGLYISPLCFFFAGCYAYDSFGVIFLLRTFFVEGQLQEYLSDEENLQEVPEESDSDNSTDVEEAAAQPGLEGHVEAASYSDHEDAASEPDDAQAVQQADSSDDSASEAFCTNQTTKTRVCQS
jgi:hypothetical protein